MIVYHKVLPFQLERERGREEREERKRGRERKSMGGRERERE